MEDVGKANLDVVGVTVAYGGVQAVREVSLTASCGQISGLIGPNGAGKTSLFNAISGLLSPTEGRIMLFGQDITRLGPAARAKRGLGRTFQRPEICPGLSVRHNVALGVEARESGESMIRQLVVTRRRRLRMTEEVERALELCNLIELADISGGQLTLGQRRLVELARACAGGHKCLLLDEPSSGLDEDETSVFAGILRKMVEKDGVGVLLVEHDMSFVMKLCNYIYVLDYGERIFEGTPREVRSSEIVKRAYLGADVVAVPIDETNGHGTVAQ